MKKSLAIGIVALGTLGIVTVTAPQAHAFGFGLRGDDTFISKLAGKLGIDVNKIKTAFDELRGEHQVEMQKSFEDRLTQAVKDGKITEEQKTKMLAKHKEMQEKINTLREKFQSMTQDERKIEMNKIRTEFETWAKANGIDLKWMRGFERGFGMGYRAGRMHGKMDTK